MSRGIIYDNLRVPRKFSLNIQSFIQSIPSDIDPKVAKLFQDFSRLLEEDLRNNFLEIERYLQPDRGGYLPEIICSFAGSLDDMTTFTSPAAVTRRDAALKEIIATVSNSGSNVQFNIEKNGTNLHSVTLTSTTPFIYTFPNPVAFKKDEDKLTYTVTSTAGGSDLTIHARFI